MNQFTEAAKFEAMVGQTYKLTENGAIARISTGDNLVDLFGTIGALRNRDESDIECKFAKAFAENRFLATKMAFYARNPRGGLGERRTGRICLKWLAKNAPDVFMKNIPALAHFGRWDDFYSYIGISDNVDEALFTAAEAQICSDLDNMRVGKPISLAAKWLKSPNASSKESRKLAALTAKHFGLSSKEYRHMLSMLRRYLKVTEVMISDGKIDEIEYAKVPSYAMKLYKNLFKKKDGCRFSEYLSRVEDGTEKINASVLYPYDLVKDYLQGYPLNRATEAQWKNLPDFDGNGSNMLVMADVSGSMYGRPMETSIGLAIYFAQHNKGAFKNLYMTFSSAPFFVHLKEGVSLKEAVDITKSTGIGYSTNLKAAFDKILAVALATHAPKSDMPDSLVVISDMEINQTKYQNFDFLTSMERQFAYYGYKMPKVVMWNVEARQDTFHASAQNPNVQFISGNSPSAFKDLIRGRSLTAVELMIEALSNPIYDMITV